MKKLFLIFTGLFCVFALTGCGGKKLVCTKTETEDGITTKAVATITYEKEKVTNINTDMDMIFSEDQKENITFYQSLMSLSFAEEKTGVEYKTSIKDNHLYLTINIDPTKISKEQLEELDYEDFIKSYNELKKELEKESFTCK